MKAMGQAAAIGVGGLLLALVQPLMASRFEEDFSGDTLRLELRILRSRGLDHYSVEGLRVEGPWPGLRARLVDSSGLGTFRFEVVDLANGQVLFSQGFDLPGPEPSESPQGGLSKGLFSIRFPEPRRPFLLRLARRSSGDLWQEAWTSAFDPRSPLFDRQPVEPGRPWTLFVNGPPPSKVDLLFLGDAYSEEELPRFHADVGRLSEELFRFEPFATHRSDFNVRAVDTPSQIPPGEDSRSRLSRLGVRFNASQGLIEEIALDDRAWRRAAASLPYDFVIVLLNSRRPAATGLYANYAALSAGSPLSPSLLLHSLGRLMAGLGDPSSPPSPNSGQPWQPNLTALLDPSRLKWKELVEDTTPLPTPWDQAAFEERCQGLRAGRAKLLAEGASVQAWNNLLLSQRSALTEALRQEKSFGKVGAFESAPGIYRPAADCVMFTLSESGFCPVCQRTLDRAIRKLSN